VLRASYETPLLHEGVRLHPPREPLAEGGRFWIGANHEPVYGPPDPRRQLNLLPDEPQFAAARRAADNYAPTFEGVQVFGHAPSVYLRDPVSGRHYSSNWLVDENGAVLSPFDFARRLGDDAVDGPIVILSCRLGDDYLQALADATGRSVYNPPDLVASFVNNGRLTLDVGRVAPDAQGRLPTMAQADSIPLRAFTPGEVRASEASFAQPAQVGDREGTVPTLTAPHLQQRPPVYRGDGFQGYWGGFDPAHPQARIDELQRVQQQAILAADVGHPGHALNVANPGSHGVPGWRDISGDANALQVFGLAPADLQPPGSRFVARLYVTDTGYVGPAMKPQLVFRGTARGVAREDWSNNLRQAVGRPTPYYQHAKNIGQRLAASGADVELVGHSLGGGLASAAALVSGRPATTFDASGLSRRARAALADGGTPLHEDAAIQAWHVDGELLTQLQRRTPLALAEGEPNPVPAQPALGSRSRVPGVEAGRRHLIGSMQAGLDSLLVHVRARADTWPAGASPVHAPGRSTQPFGRFGGTEADMRTQLDTLLAATHANAGEIHALAREAQLIRDVAAQSRGDGVLPLYSRDRRRLLHEFEQRFREGTPADRQPQGLAQLDAQAALVADRLKAHGIDLRVHDGYVREKLLAGPDTAPPPATPAPVVPPTRREKVVGGLKTFGHQVASWTYGPAMVGAGILVKGPSFLSGEFFQKMALFNRTRTGAVNGGSAAWGRMRENALRGVMKGESFEQAAVHLDRIAGWRGDAMGLTRATKRGDVLALRENLHAVHEARQQLLALERSEPAGSQRVVDARKAVETAQAAYRKTPLGSRTMSYNHPLGSPVRNVSLAVSAASIVSFLTMHRFGIGYPSMNLAQKLVLASPSAMLLGVQARYMVAQARSLADRANTALKAAETRAFWRQAWPYPAVITGDVTTAIMGFSSGHHVEGAAYAARAVLNTALWRLVMKRAQRIPDGQPQPWWYKVPGLNQVLHPKEALNPTVKHWTTVAVVGGLLAASGTAYLAHPKADGVAPTTPPDPDPTPTPTPTPSVTPTDPATTTPGPTTGSTVPGGSPDPSAPTTSPSGTHPSPGRTTRTPPRNVPITAGVADRGPSLWQAAQTQRDALLTDEHRQRIAAEGLGGPAQTVLALSELLQRQRRQQVSV